MKEAVVIGSGAGGAMCAKELQGRFQVTILEAGREFRPLKASLPLLGQLRKTRLLFDTGEIGWIFAAMKIRKAGSGMILVSGSGSGGTTTISTGNAIRLDRDLRELGIDLDEEFAELYDEIPIFAGHQEKWRPLTRQFFAICREMKLEPRTMPKMGDYAHCRNCGRCVLGCPHGIKWDSRQLLQQAQQNGARLLASHRALRIVHEKGRAHGVLARHGLKKKWFPADLVILAAGGLGTPLVLQDSGITCDAKLFVDPVLCVAAEMKDSFQNREMPMPFAV
jgi:choline dehydrogenase-like flavoprotein